MKPDTNYIKHQFSNLCDALVRNVNDNFISVSFDIKANGTIQVLIILIRKTFVELEYIDDMIAEFSGLQIEDAVLKPLIFVGNNHLPLENVVFTNGRDFNLAS